MAHNNVQPSMSPEYMERETNNPGAMGASGGPSDHAPTPTDLGPNRHGSAEQNARVYLNTMNDTGNTPVPSGRRTPQTPTRARSRRRYNEDDNDDDNDNEDRRDRRRERQDRHQEDEPVGVGFRLNACETSLRDHHSELTAQRKMVNQLTDEVKRLNAEREIHGQRLDAVFSLVDQRFSETQKAVHETQTVANDKITTLETALTVASDKIMNLQKSLDNASTGLAARIEQIYLEVGVLRREQSARTAEPPSAPASAPTPPPGMSQSTTPNPTPPSWTAASDQDARRENPSTGYARTSSNIPTFGSTAPTDGPQHFNVGSPLNGPSSAENRSPWGPWGNDGAAQSNPQPSAPDFQSAGPAHSHHRANFTPGQNAAGAGTQLRPFDPRDWNTDGKKISKELRVYDGDIAHYDTWRMRVRNHFVGTNCNYLHVFDLIEKCKTPIAWAALAYTNVDELPYMDWHWIATHLWTFTGNFLNDSQLKHRSTLVGNEEFNGLEYWRALYAENIGGSTQLANLERGHFIGFPNCSDLGQLEAHLKQWVMLKGKYGAHLPDDHLIGMLWTIIPDAIRDDIKKQRHLTGRLNDQIAWIYAEINERTDNKLSKWNLSQLQHQLKFHNKNSTGISAAIPEPPTPDLATFTATMERTCEKMINAAMTRTGRPPARTPPGSRAGSSGSQRTGRRIPSASFKGCWCCGSESHRRQDCPEFKAIKSKNGGKVPKDYVGAWEKSVKPKTGPSKLTAAIEVETHDEHSETLRMWPVLPMRNPISTNNGYGILTDLEDSDDDESDVLKALSAISSNVVRADERTSQRVRKSQHRAKNSLDVTRLNAIARDVKSGKISLPEVDLSHNADFEYVWALVDSGAGANVAKTDVFNESTPVSAPSITLSTANGGALPHRGAHQVTAYNQDGSTVKRVFYNADVEMPILAVSELSKEGPAGSEVRLRLKDGYIRDLHTGQEQPVVKRRGVYFTKMYMRKSGPPDPSSGFTRPGLP